VKNGSQAANQRFFDFPVIRLFLLIPNIHQHCHISSGKDFEPRRSHLSPALIFPAASGGCLSHDDPESESFYCRIF
jgi:hypothetical protein